MVSNDWNLLAGMAIEQILERNENGNLSPLTSLEVKILTDIKEMLSPNDEPAEPAPAQKPSPATATKQNGKTGQPPKEPAKKREYVSLDNKDLTG